MKNKKVKGIFIAVLLVLLIAAAWIAVSVTVKNKELDMISSIYYWGNDGSMALSNYSYSAVLEDDAVKITVMRKGSDEELTFKEDAAFLERLTEIANKYEIGSWDGFEKYDRNVMDGSSFSLSIYTESGQEIDARGYMKYPKNYGEAMEEIKCLFDEIYNGEYTK